MKKLAVFFPRIGYHCDKPLLYYGRKIAEERGFKDCISLSYSYEGKNIRRNQKKSAGQSSFSAWPHG